MATYKRAQGTYSQHGMPVALEYEGDTAAAKVGMIIATFAAIERELPTVISRMTGMTQIDSVALCAVFRSFSSRVDILGALLKLRDETHHDKIVYGYCKGLFVDSHKIRNRYAHALYAKGERMRLSPFHNDLKSPDKWENLEPQLSKDDQRIKIILGELFAILHQQALPAGLYERLLPQDR
jgi:hypothetical protein